MQADALSGISKSHLEYYDAPCLEKEQLIAQLIGYKSRENPSEEAIDQAFSIAKVIESSVIPCFALTNICRAYLTLLTEEGCCKAYEVVQYKDKLNGKIIDLLNDIVEVCLHLKTAKTLALAERIFVRYPANLDTEHRNNFYSLLEQQLQERDEHSAIKYFKTLLITERMVNISAKKELTSSTSLINSLKDKYWSTYKEAPLLAIQNVTQAKLQINEHSLDRVNICYCPAKIAVSERYICVSRWIDCQKRLHFFDVNTREKVTDMLILDDCGYHVVKSMCNRFYYVGGKQVLMIDPESGTIAHTFTVPNIIRGVQAFGDKLIIITNDKPKYYIWSLTSGLIVANGTLPTFVFTNLCSLHLNAETLTLSASVPREGQYLYSLVKVNLADHSSALYDISSSQSELNGKLNWFSKLGNYYIASCNEGLFVANINSDEWKKIPCGKLSMDECCLDGKLLLTAKDTIIQAWHIETGELLQSIDTESNVFDLFTSNGKITVIIGKSSASIFIKVLDVIHPEQQKLMDGESCKIVWR